MSEEENQEKKNQSAKDVAEAMVENMKKNMEDPEFFKKRDKIIEEVTNNVLKAREERHKKLEEE
ncbi:MAG: hypothetical protein KGD67_10760 [Candidatus Lokiarchaeota archaeon]|nr:hypothetical protein [Candidatus Lokiarchaeota archaeon]